VCSSDLGVNIERLLEGNQALRVGVDVKLDYEW